MHLSRRMQVSAAGSARVMGNSECMCQDGLRSTRAAAAALNQPLVSTILSKFVARPDSILQLRVKLIGTKLPSETSPDPSGDWGSACEPSAIFCYSFLHSASV